MNHLIYFAFCIFILLAGCETDKASTPNRTTAMIIDHTCTDLSQISDEQIDAIQQQIRIHYAHTSHGSQITAGLERLETKNRKYDVAIDYSSLPTAAGALCIFDGQENETYITPDLYWESADGLQFTKNVLDHNPTINISLWSWCTQLEYYSADETQNYLDTMTDLEEAYPNIVFVYMTGNAQAESENRHARNNQIRDYCLQKNKVLFDFADLDCWYNGQQHTINGIPCEHPHYYGDQAGHTTYESCENKAKAFWVMLARLLDAQVFAVHDFSRQTPHQLRLEQNYPNPFNPVTRIVYQVATPLYITLKVYNLQGQLIKTLVDEFQTVGMKTVAWNGLNERGNRAASGIYLYQIDAGSFTQSKRMMMVK